MYIIGFSREFYIISTSLFSRKPAFNLTVYGLPFPKSSSHCAFTVDHLNSTLLFITLTSCLVEIAEFIHDLISNIYSSVVLPIKQCFRHDSTILKSKFDISV